MTKEINKGCCDRCGLPESEWGGRWQEPLCKVGKTTYENHLSQGEISRLEAEISVYWSEIAENLPKSMERSALGDHKIFLAFRLAYPKIRGHIRQSLQKEVKEEVADLGKKNETYTDEFGLGYDKALSEVENLPVLNK